MKIRLRTKMINNLKFIGGIAVLFLLCNFAFGQGDRKLSVGVHGGPAGATMYGDEESRKIHNIKFKPVFSFIAGINMQYVVKPKFWFHIELNYERKGYEENWPVSDQNQVVIGTDVQKNYYDYITLPIMGKFILNKKKIKLFVTTGIYLGYFINSRWDSLPTASHPGSKGSQKPNGRYYNLTDFGLVTGLGWDIPMGERFQFSMEIRNNLGFSGIYKYCEKFSSRNIKQESLGALFGLGYKI